MLDEVKDKSLHLVPSTVKKETYCLVKVFGFWRHCNPHMGILLLSIHLVTWKAAGLSGTRVEKDFEAHLGYGENHSATQT